MEAIKFLLFSLILASPLIIEDVSSNASPINPFVIGGQNVTNGEFPFLVGIWVDGGIVCAGTLIDKNVILTAAHCLRDWQDKDFQVTRIKIKAGDHDIYEVDEFEQTTNVGAFIIHPEYIRNGSFVTNDIAIIFTTTPYNITDLVQPTPLPPKGGESSESHHGIAVGWGVATDGSIIASQFPRKVDLDLATDSYCEEKYDFYGFHKELQMCSGNHSVGICYGDYGGPFLMGKDGVFEGIISYAPNSGCREDYIGNLFTRVAPYLDWIKEMRSNVTDSTTDKSGHGAGIKTSAQIGIVIFIATFEVMRNVF